MESENQIPDLIQIKAEENTLKIINSAKLGLIDTPEDLFSYRPEGMPIVYGVLKGKVTSLLGINVITDQNVNKISGEIETALNLTYTWVNAGLQFHQEKTGMREIIFLCLSSSMCLKERY